ncbi:MAG: Na+/H+ antiporter subunit E [Halobacteriaceae archaeon]
MRVRAWPVIGLILSILWLFVRGIQASISTFIGELLLGLIIGVPIAYLFRNLYIDTVRISRSIRAIPYAIVYILVFVKDLILANFDVAYRVLAPSMPIYPRVVVFPLRVQTDLAITTIANSITLTPGTLSMDYDAERNALYIHTIDGRNREQVVAPIRTWEKYALVIFNEEKKPGDPIPSKEGGEQEDGG